MKLRGVLTLSLILVASAAQAAPGGKPDRQAPTPYQHRFVFDVPQEAGDSPIASDTVPTSHRLEVHFIECHGDSPQVERDLALVLFRVESVATGMSWDFIPDAPPYSNNVRRDENGQLRHISRWGVRQQVLLHFSSGDVVTVKSRRDSGVPEPQLAEIFTGACVLSGFLIPE